MFLEPASAASIRHYDSGRSQHAESLFKVFISCLSDSVEAHKVGCAVSGFCSPDFHFFEKYFGFSMRRVEDGFGGHERRRRDFSATNFVWFETEVTVPFVVDLGGSSAKLMFFEN